MNEENINERSSIFSYNAFEEPTIEETVETVVEPIVEPVAEPAVEPVEPFVAPTVEPTPEPVVEPVVEAVKPDIKDDSDKVALHSSANLFKFKLGELKVGYNIVSKEAASVWLKSKKVRVATPQEVAEYYNK